MKLLRIAFLIGVLVSSVGCGGEPKPNYSLSPVSGTFKINGKPVPDIYVDFVPTGTTKGLGASARTDAEGHYKLKDRRGGDGASPGEYKIVLATSIMADGSDAPKDPKTPKLPMQYTMPNDTPIKKSVPEGGGTIDIDVEIKGLK